jgi:hypothetical protein
MKMQPMYDQPPPLELVPPEARDVKLSWFHSGGWYMLQFVKAV